MLERFTDSGVRLRERARRPGELDWLFLPGGPGIGSESLEELVDELAVPGRAWLVDLPGDGSNRGFEHPYDKWPGVLIEAALAVERPVFAGHSTGGMYLLSVPELESRLAGLALVSTAPDASWLPAFVAMTEAHPLPAVDEANARFEADPTDANLGAIAVASAPWNFTHAGVEAGAELLARMPYNRAAVQWSAEHFDATYRSLWWPSSLPTLILSGGADRIVTQAPWEDPRFAGEHVIHRTVHGAGHFPWIERPEEVAAAFADLADRIESTP